MKMTQADREILAYGVAKAIRGAREQNGSTASFLTPDDMETAKTSFLMWAAGSYSMRQAKPLFDAAWNTANNSETSHAH